MNLKKTYRRNIDRYLKKPFWYRTIIMWKTGVDLVGFFYRQFKLLLSQVIFFNLIINDMLALSPSFSQNTFPLQLQNQMTALFFCAPKLL